MKTCHLMILTCSLFLLTRNSFAQTDSSGIYKTSEDFRQRKLSYAINCKTENHKINPEILFKGSAVKVKHMGNTYILKKSEVFGYRDCNEKEFRFVDGAIYSILNPGETLIIYSYQHRAHSPKNAAEYPLSYFYSNNTTLALQQLTKANLKASYPVNHKFHDTLDANFKEDADLVAYDRFHKMYKLNWIIKNLTD